jgi:hypothetical protein
MITVNATVKFTYRNKGTFFGVHVSSTPLDLSYSEIVIGTGNVSHKLLAFFFFLCVNVVCVWCSNRYEFRLIAIGNPRVHTIIILVVTRSRSNGLDCVRSLSDNDRYTDWSQSEF